MSVILSHQQITILFTVLLETLLNIWSKTGPDTAPPNTAVNLFPWENSFFFFLLFVLNPNLLIDF